MDSWHSPQAGVDPFALWWWHFAQSPAMSACCACENLTGPYTCDMLSKVMVSGMSVGYATAMNKKMLTNEIETKIVFIIIVPPYVRIRFLPPTDKPLAKRPPPGL